MDHKNNKLQYYDLYVTVGILLIFINFDAHHGTT